MAEKIQEGLQAVENSQPTTPGELPKKYGKQLSIKTREQLKKAIKRYFDECDTGDKNGEPIPYTNSGLALSLGISRATLINYRNSEQYGDIISIARTRIENSMEKRLFGKAQCVGAIFALKNSFPGWVDKSETKVSGPLGDILDTIQNAKTKSFITKRN